MITRLAFLTGVALLLTSCSLQIPNGVFSCVNAGDCPGNYFCWVSDGRCYDAEEPPNVCVASTCEQVVQQFSSLDVTVECGELPDGCEGTVECPPCGAGETCGANGQSFMCGCEENSCSSVEAQCGQIPIGCEVEGTIDCGQCPGQLECRNNRCICPTGDCECPQGCADGEICVAGECCAPRFPCVDNECSPPGGFDDGCGGVTQCPPCAEGEQCQPDTDTQSYQCVAACTCESEGIECGTANVCNSSQFCGLCADSAAPLCEDGRCVCEDRYESNEDPQDAYPLSCIGGCSVKTLSLEVSGTLDNSNDFDFYHIDVVHSDSYAIRLDVSGLQSTRQIFLTYICPDGSERIKDCSGSSSSLGSEKYCVEDGADTLVLVQDCQNQSGGIATIIAAVSAKEGEFSGPCDDYTASLSTYFFADL